MEFTHFEPSDILKPYVRHYYIFESDADNEFEDIVFPSGDMELIFNLGAGIWESSNGDTFVKTPKIELWGQITRPLLIRSSGRHTMLGIKFFPHSAGYFFNDEVGIFNDRISDFGDLTGNPARVLHMQLMDTTDPGKRINHIENFLLKRLISSEKKAVRIDKVAHILTSLKNNSFESSLGAIASQHGITPRYLHKLVHRHTGLSPAFFNKISRFQSSLKLVVKNNQPLTTIAYQAGYFDQSHFIRDFKSFTGLTPSSYTENASQVNLMLAQ